MNTIFSFLLAILLLPINSIAQGAKSKLTWGETAELKFSRHSLMLGASEDFIYVLSPEAKNLIASYSNQNSFLKKFDRHTMKEVSSTLIPEFEYSGEKAVLLRGSMFNGSLNLYYKVSNKDTKINYLFHRYIDKKGSLSPPRMLFEMRNESMRNWPFTFHSSRNSSQLLIHSRLPGKKNENVSFHLHVFNTEHELEWEREVTLPYEENAFLISKEGISNDGNVFILGYADSERSGLDKLLDNDLDDFKIFMITEEKDEAIEYDLNLDEDHVLNASMYIDFQDNELVLAGLYADMEITEASGTFFKTFKQDELAPGIDSRKPFSKEILQMFLSQKRVEKGYSNLNGFKFRQILKRENGGVVLIAERYWLSYVQNDDGSRSTKYYYNKDILIIDLTNEGEIRWVSHIPKDQHDTHDDWLLSYKVALDNDNLHFLYNDNPKNIDRIKKNDDLKTANDFKKPMITMATVDDKGEVSYSFLSLKDEETAMFPERSLVVPDQGIVIFGIQSRRMRLGSVKF